MNEKRMMDLVRTLSQIHGPSGYEVRVAEAIKRELDKERLEIKCDRIGNVIATVPGKNRDKRLMISAHMDEVGFMINRIDDDGYLHFSCVGGIDDRVLCGHRVVVLGTAGDVKGVITSKPIHLQTEKERAEATPKDKMYIDIGAASKEDAEKYVALGDFGTFDSEFVEFGKDGKNVKSKALDDRLGCAIMIELIRDIAECEFDYDISFAFSVREEIGLSGATVAANIIEPDLAIVLETTAIADIIDVPESNRVAYVGEGGVLSIADRGTIYNRAFFDLALSTAKKNDIKCQVKKFVSGGNDAAHIHKSGAGVRCIALSAPTRYLHSATCVIDKNDAYAMKALVRAIFDELNDNWIGA